MKLRELRAQKLLSQQGLAREAGLSVATVTGIETGIHLPSPTTSRKLAAALGVEPTDIDEVQAAIDRAMGQASSEQE